MGHLFTFTQDNTAQSQQGETKKRKLEGGTNSATLISSQFKEQTENVILQRNHPVKNTISINQYHK